MFGRKRKINKNYYISPHGEEYLNTKARNASVLAISVVVPLLVAFVLWIAPGIGSTLWLYEYYEAQVAYVLIFFCSLIGSIFCAVMSFFFFKIRKKVMEKDAPTLGFRRSSYNGIFFSALVITLLFIYHIVMLIGFSVSLGSGYIALIIAKYNLSAAAQFDAVSVIEIVLTGIAAALAWAYYVYTFRVNRTMQLVIPDAPAPSSDELAVPSAEEALKHKPAPRYDDYEPPKPTFCLTKEEIERGKVEFMDDDESAKRAKKQDKAQSGSENTDITDNADNSNNSDNSDNSDNLTDKK